MIIADYSGTIISVLYASKLIDMFSKDRKEEPNIDLLRSAVLNTLKSYKKIFKARAGKELIIAADSGSSWRKTFFTHYKQNRKKSRDDSPLDWNLIFQAINQILNEINEFSPFTVLKIPHTEADDIIAVLSKERSQFFRTSADSGQYHSLFDLESTSTKSSTQELSEFVSIIVSEDKDFHQLQYLPGVEQFLPRKKSFFVDKFPLDSLAKKIIFGDSGDGIPNVLSDDDTFVIQEKRQKVITEKRLNLILPWAEKQIHYTESLYDPQMKDPEINILQGWCRNRKSIDFRFIPLNIQDQILKEYQEKSNIQKPSGEFLDYLIQHKCKLLISDIQDFF